MGLLIEDTGKTSGTKVAQTAHSNGNRRNAGTG